MEVLLVDESSSQQIPLKLEALISSYLTEITEMDCDVLKADFLVIVLYELMIETGFTLLNSLPSDSHEGKPLRQSY